jgi:hypothetical protein
MQTAHFHVCSRDTPFGMLEIKLGPFGLAELARPDKHQ